ncbi:MAG: enhanced intracellular survival protein Eis, partial [Actinomycetes bacterium]
DADDSRRLGQEAFGVPTTPPTGPARLDRPGALYYGAYEGDRLVARLLDRDYHSWFGGAAVPTAGIAGVTVAVEHRGQGRLRPLLQAALAAARDRGAVVSTLFPTASRIYRGLGYEVVADYARVRVPTWVLATVARPVGTWTRRAAGGDFDAVRAVYDRWAEQQNGPLTRRGPSFTATAEDFVGSFTGVTLAEDERSGVVGYASWDRGQGYGEGAALEISDLLAVTADGYRALLAAMGSNSSVTASTTLHTSGDDVIRTFLPTLYWEPVDAKPYMLRVLDVVGALTARRYPPGVDAALPFRLSGDPLAALDGGYLLEVADGTASCRRAGVADDHTFSPQGLALLYAGTQSCGNLRFTGHLAGGDPKRDLLWDALFGGRRAHIRDYF